MSADTLLHRRLEAHPLWRAIQPSERHLLEAGLRFARWPAGAQLAAAGADIEQVVLVLDDDGAAASRCIGLEGLVGARAFAHDVTATAPGGGCRLPLAALRLVASQGTAFAHAVRNALARQEPSPPHATDRPASDDFRPRVARGWLAALLGPVALAWVLSQHTALDRAQIQFIAAICAGLIVWLTNLAPPFVGCLLALVGVCASGAAPAEVAFAGFTGPAFYLLLGILALSATINASGLALRGMVAVLRRLPARPGSYHAGLFAIGAVLTLGIPSAAGRLQLLVPLLRELARSAGWRGEPSDRRGPLGHLVLAGFTGATVLSTCFLTSNPGNLLILGMLPEHWQESFDWIAWAEAAAGFAVSFLVLYGAGAYVLVRRGGWFALSRGDLSRQLAVLGPPSTTERIATLAVLLFAAGAALGAFHHIPAAVIALFVLLLLVACGAFGADALSRDIPWPMLIYLLGITGIAKGFVHLGLDTVVAERLDWLAPAMAHGQSLFLLGLIGLVVLMRLALPALVCVSTLGALLLPVASNAGLNPWAVGFILITVSEGWFLPYQSSDYLLFRSSAGPAIERVEPRLLRYNAMVQACKLVALAVSIAWWRHLGIVT